jgi:adenylate cyclase
MPTRLTRLLDVGVRPADDDDLITRKRLLTAGGILVPAVLFSLGVVYLAYGETVAGLDYSIYALWVWLNVALFAWHGRMELGVWLVAIPALATHLVATLALGDLVHSGGVILWGLAFPGATGLVFIPLRKVAPFFAAYAVNIVIGVLIVPADRSDLPSTVERTILLSNVLALSAFTIAVLALFVSQRDRAFRLLAEEQRKAEALLLNILPREIARELSERPGTIAQQFDSVSVLFCDVVGFTPMSESMTATELVEVLDELFSCFDDLVQSRDLEKIKTIGDCYMVAAGIPRARDDHASALVSLALEMQAAARDRTFRGRRLELRVGINSGSVVAGVIGRRKFSYDLWGDVVNTASRMESHGRAGEVQLTAATHALVQREFDCEPRGVLAIKGKGDLEVWIVADRRRRPRPRRDAPATAPASY